MASGKCDTNFKGVTFKPIIQNSSLATRCEIALRWMPLNRIGDESIFTILVEVMAWCRQATRHYMSQCWLRSMGHLKRIFFFCQNLFREWSIACAVRSAQRQYSIQPWRIVNWPLRGKISEFEIRYIFFLFQRICIWKCSWWRHQMETFSALLVLCSGNSPVTGEFPAQRPVTRSFDVFFDLRLNKRLSKQSWGWWFETPSRPLWRHCNAHQNVGHCVKASVC